MQSSAVPVRSPIQTFKIASSNAAEYLPSSLRLVRLPHVG
jgi:hypothetical protein